MKDHKELLHAKGSKTPDPQEVTWNGLLKSSQDQFRGRQSRAYLHKIYWNCDLQKQVPAKPEDVSTPQLGNTSD